MRAALGKMAAAEGERSDNPAPAVVRAGREDEGPIKRLQSHANTALAMQGAMSKMNLFKKAPSRPLSGSKKANSVGVDSLCADPHRHRLFMTPPIERTEDMVPQLVKSSKPLASNFFGRLTAEQHADLARGWHYLFAAKGTPLVEAHEEPEYFFIVLAGSVQVREPRVKYQETSTTSSSSLHDDEDLRTNGIGAGGVFGHYPLVHEEFQYRYSAKVVDPAGASVLLVPRADYVYVLRRDVERNMVDTVNMLRSALP
jgi:hypothetical protein